MQCEDNHPHDDAVDIPIGFAVGYFIQFEQHGTTDDADQQVPDEFSET